MVQMFRTFHLNREKIKSGGSPKFSIFFLFFCFVLFCFVLFLFLFLFLFFGGKSRDSFDIQLKFADFCSKW